jgi:hypothetical protein
MDRTLLGYRKQCLPLFGRELSLEVDLDVDLVERTHHAIAVGGVLGVHLCV